MYNFHTTTNVLKDQIAAGYKIVGTKIIFAISRNFPIISQVSSTNTGQKDNNSKPTFLWTLVKKDDDDDKKKQNVDLIQKLDILIEKIDRKEQHLDNFVGKVETLGNKLDILIEKIDEDRKEQQKSVDTLVKAISSLVEQLDKKNEYTGAKYLWTLVKKKNNDDKKNNQIDALGQKIDILIEKIDQDRKEQQKSVDTLVKAISSLVEQLDKKSGKLTLG
ncbi:hypothetical protein niasHT_019853 [Heterodera trifolii]|uniref:Uncharacterized protein n=1 Tax=Heterodera trifolii TaxID=157864 RepID=A0ABD2KUV4_9BILA